VLSQNTLNTTKKQIENKRRKQRSSKSKRTPQTFLESKQNSFTYNKSNPKQYSNRWKGKRNSTLVAVLSALSELLVVCYWFVYQYFQSCLLEHNLQTDNTLVTTLSHATRSRTSNTELSPNLKKQIFAVDKKA
jgi:hypothetical protein